MSARHWKPPAFLLPSWTESQLALAQRALPLATTSPSTANSFSNGRSQHARLHENSSSSRSRGTSSSHSSQCGVSLAISSSYWRPRSRHYHSYYPEGARSGQQQKGRRQSCQYSSAAASDSRQQGHSYESGWGHEVADSKQRGPGTKKSAVSASRSSGVKLRYFVKKDAGDIEWDRDSRPSPRKEVNRLLELNSRRKTNGSSRNSVPREEVGSSMRQKGQNNSQQWHGESEEQLKVQDGAQNDNRHGISSKEEFPSQKEGPITAPGSQGDRLRQSEAKAASRSFVALSENRSKAMPASNDTTLFPSWKVSKSSQPPGANVGVEKELSLLEELFPELAALQAKDDSKKMPAHREVPRLRIADIDFSASADPEDDDLPSTSQSRKPVVDRAVEKFEDSEVAILVFRTWDTSLSEADFQRIVPRGSHIEEWRELGSFIQVIPVRKSPSLTPVGHYLLLFRNAGYRAAYKRSAERLAALSARSVPGSIEGVSLERPHKPHRDARDESPDSENGPEDTSVLLNEYALTPRPRLGAAAPLFFQDSSVRKSKALMRLVEHRGYDEIAGRAGRVVILWVDGYGPLDSEVRRMLRVDGRDRGIAWTATGRIERLELLKGSRNEEDDFGDSVYSREDEENESDGNNSYHKWLLEFDDETEARRFVRNWHLRKWPHTSDRSGQQGELEAIIHAELLW